MICYILLGHTHQSEQELFGEAEKERKAREDEVRSLQTSSCFLFKSSLYNLITSMAIQIDIYRKLGKHGKKVNADGRRGTIDMETGGGVTNAYVHIDTKSILKFFSFLTLLFLE